MLVYSILRNRLRLRSYERFKRNGVKTQLNCNISSPIRNNESSSYFTMVDSAQSTQAEPARECQNRMAKEVVEAIVQRFGIMPSDKVEVTDVAVSKSAPKVSFWCRFEILRDGTLLQTGALLAWFLGEGMPPVLQFFQQATL